MTAKTLATMGCLGGSLFLAEHAQATYVDTTVNCVADVNIDGADWRVFRVYVNVDNPADSVEAISGNAASSSRRASRIRYSPSMPVYDRERRRGVQGFRRVGIAHRSDQSPKRERGVTCPTRRLRSGF